MKESWQQEMYRIVSLCPGHAYRKGFFFSKIFFLVLAFSFFLLCPKPAFAQDASDFLFDGELDSETTLDDMFDLTQSEIALTNKISQPFSWTSAGDVLKYRIEIDLIGDDGRMETVFVHETTEEENETCLIYIDPLLPPGQYRSTIKVYNILGGLEEDLTSTDEFVIRKAYRPEVRNVNYPLYMRSTIYLDDLDNDGIIEVEGRNLFMSDEERAALAFTDYYLKNDSRTIWPEKIVSHDDDRNRKIKLQFNMNRLPVGEYHLFAQDASGLHSEAEGSSKLTVKFKKWLDIDVEGGYMFPVVLHDKTYEHYFDEKTTPISSQFKVSVIPLKFHWGYLGFGFRAAYARPNGNLDNYSIDGNMIFGHALFIFQKPILRRRVTLELHAGAGMTYFNNMMYHYPYGITSDPLNTISFSAEGGAAAQIYINRRLFVEVGADYVLTLNKDMNLGMIQPSVGIGWQF